MSSVACCSGTVHEGDPRGRVETLHGLPTYITEPPNGVEFKCIVVMIPDAFGWEIPNSRILADIYSERINAQLLLPDFMEGKVLDYKIMPVMGAMTDKKASFASKILPVFKVATTLGPFMYTNRRAITGPRIVKYLKALRESTTLPIGAAGYCWGGQHVVLLAHGTDTVNNKPLIDAAFVAHPSGLDLPSEIEQLKVPISISQGSEDFVLDMAGVKTIQGVFDKKNGNGKGEFEIKVVDGAKHGFAVRGNLEDEEEAKQCQIAEDQAVEWFTRWLGKKGKV